MLLQLFINNFALIDRLEVEFGQGLNVLTGETGAGKSILIDAVSLLLGGRAESDFIRTGSDKALVEGVFGIGEAHSCHSLLAELGFESEDHLIMSRELSANGRNLCRINGRVVTLSVFKQMGQTLIDIYGQHQHQSLLDPDKHRGLLDTLGDDIFRSKLKEMEALYQQWQQCKQQLESLQRSEKETNRLLDLYLFQREEIRAANLIAGEEEQLHNEKRRLGNSEKLMAGCSESYSLLAEGNESKGSVLNQLRQVSSSLQNLGKYDTQLVALASRVDESLYNLEDVNLELRNYIEGLDFEPQSLERVEERLDLINQLKRKYGDSIEEIQIYLDKIELELSRLENSDQEILRLTSLEQELYQQASQKAQELTDTRRQLADFLATALAAELQELGMAKAKFECQITAQALTETGCDKLEFMFSANQGESLKPLAKIASGGEMSRIMLAFKVILAQVDAIETMIFDEVDTGIGGKTALAVGQKLSQVSKQRQVLCVTHSPQVTSFGDHHFYIYKSEQGERTVTQLKLLSREEQVTELARMLGGARVTDTTLQHAREMLAMAQN